MFEQSLHCDQEISSISLNKIENRFWKGTLGFSNCDFNQ